MKFNDYMNALYKGQEPNSIPEFVEAKRKLIKAILTETDDVPVFIPFSLFIITSLVILTISIPLV